MILIRRILPVAILVAMLALLPSRVGAAECATIGASSSIDATTDELPETADAPCFRLASAPLLSTSTTATSSQSVTPLVRTLPRVARSAERAFQHTKAVSSIDSSTAASRYGLYNHRVLFVSLARDYYLARTEILRI